MISFYFCFCFCIFCMYLCVHKYRHPFATCYPLSVIRYLLTTTTERQTHRRSLSASKSTSIVGSNLSGAGRVRQKAGIVHYKSIGNVSFGVGDHIGVLRREGSARRHVSVENRKLCRSREREVQRHFII